MVKKILFTIAVVAFLTASVQAVDSGVYKLKYDGMWPYEYIAMPICTIPILMDVGYFVQLEKCGDYKIKLKQVPCDSDELAEKKSKTTDFPCYVDCEDIKIRANFEVKLGGKVVDEVSWFAAGDTKVFYRAGEGITPDVVPGDGAWYTRKVCVQAWDVQIWNSGEGAQGDEIEVAKLQITVKPTQEPWWEGSGE